MTVEEIFSAITNHMIKGLMVHEQMANYYDFLGLQGYKRCHEYHYFSENKTYRKTMHYYIKHYHKLLPELRFENPNLIPGSWFQHVSKDVDRNTKQNAVEEGLTKWAKWERSTVSLYQQMYKELVDIGEIAAAAYVMTHLINDVSEELSTVEQYQLNKSATGYDLVNIVEEQKPIHSKYKKKY